MNAINTNLFLYRIVIDYINKVNNWFFYFYYFKIHVNPENLFLILYFNRLTFLVPLFKKIKLN